MNTAAPARIHVCVSDPGSASLLQPSVRLTRSTFSRSMDARCASCGRTATPRSASRAPATCSSSEWSADASCTHTGHSGQDTHRACDLAAVAVRSMGAGSCVQKHAWCVAHPFACV
eukprot:361497-Chlamydomonas_euryale.AAC.11